MAGWSPSDYAAWYAAALSTGVALTGLYRWATSGRARFRAHATFEHSYMIAGGQKHVRIVLRNIGDIETTLQRVAMFSVARRVPSWTLNYEWVRIAAGWRPVANGGFFSWPGHREASCLVAPNKEFVFVYQPATGETDMLRQSRFIVAVYDTASASRGQFVSLRCG